MTSPLLATGYYTVYNGSAAADQDLLFTTDELSSMDCFTLHCETGRVTVEAQTRVNGPWTTALALQDLTDVEAGLYTAAYPNKNYGLVGNFHALRVRQSGATAAAATLRGWSRTFHG